MPEPGSNQYPRLPWERNPDPIHGGFIARPHGPDGGIARVHYDRVQAPGDAWTKTSYWWVWTAVWAERFGKHGHVYADTNDAAKQAAADAATIAYWDLMEETEGWAPPPPPPPPFIDLMQVLHMRRFHAWLERASKQEIGAQVRRYMLASVQGPTIISKELDREMWSQLSQALYHYDFRGFPKQY